MRFPVAFVRKSDTYSAAYATPGVGNWLPGLEPQRFDMVFERSRDSCYESQAFDEMMKYSYHKFILAGFGEIAFFATAVDAYRREHAFIYLADAVISCEFGDASAIRLQRAIVNAINFFGQVTTTRIWTQGIPQNLVLTR
jgi:isochorismate hydrolase